MTKDLFINPQAVQLRSELASVPIPINAYQPDLAAERSSIGDAKLMTLARDMILIREFELMLDSISDSGGVDAICQGRARCVGERRISEQLAVKSVEMSFAAIVVETSPRQGPGP